MELAEEGSQVGVLKTKLGGNIGTQALSRKFRQHIYYKKLYYSSLDKVQLI